MDEEEEEEDSEDGRAEQLERERRKKQQEIRLRQEKKREAARQARLEQALASKVGWHATEACTALLALHPPLVPVGSVPCLPCMHESCTHDRMRELAATLCAR